MMIICYFFFSPADISFLRSISLSISLEILSSVIRAYPCEELTTLYKTYYEQHPFVLMSDEPVSLKQVVNTNYCFIHPDKEGDNVLVTSMIDNLIKGASGQAVQNMNLMFGLDEMTGLRLKANYF